MRTCPDCPDHELEMYEHYDEYDGDVLRQEQYFQCRNCLRTFARTVWYKQTAVEWFPDEEE